MLLLVMARSCTWGLKASIPKRRRKTRQRKNNRQSHALCQTTVIRRTTMGAAVKRFVFPTISCWVAVIGTQMTQMTTTTWRNDAHHQHKLHQGSTSCIKRPDKTLDDDECTANAKIFYLPSATCMSRRNWTHIKRKDYIYIKKGLFLPWADWGLVRATSWHLVHSCPTQVLVIPTKTLYLIARQRSDPVIGRSWQVNPSLSLMLCRERSLCRAIDNRNTFLITYE